MVNKIVSSIIFVLFLLGLAIYFRVEFKYMMVLNNRGSLILNQLSKALKDPVNQNENFEDRVAAIAEKNGVRFATDYMLMENFLFKSCKEECLNRPVFYKTYMKIIALIQIKKLWVVEQNRLKDSVAYYIQEREEKQFLNNFTTRRAFISENYTKLPSYDLKELALSLTQTMDAKVMEIRKK
jgi:hypothetical protein